MDHKRWRSANIEIKYHHEKQTRMSEYKNNPRSIDTVTLSDMSISGVTNCGTVHLHVTVSNGNP